VSAKDEGSGAPIFAVPVMTMGRSASPHCCMDKVISSAVITIAGVLAVVAIIRFVMPPLADATNSLAQSGDSLTADIDQVIAIGAVSMSDGATVEVWVKNAGSAPIEDLALMTVEFGAESNPVPFAYGGAGCAAPCWSYELDGATWSPGETIRIEVTLASPAGSGSLHRVAVRGPRGGHASETVRAP
jgi:hypothetical protein